MSSKEKRVSPSYNLFKSKVDTKTGRISPATATASTFFGRTSPSFGRTSPSFGRTSPSFGKKETPSPTNAKPEVSIKPPTRATRRKTPFTPIERREIRSPTKVEYDILDDILEHKDFANKNIKQQREAFVEKLVSIKDDFIKNIKSDEFLNFHNESKNFYGNSDSFYSKSLDNFMNSISGKKGSTKDIDFTFDENEFQEIFNINFVKDYDSLTDKELESNIFYILNEYEYIDPESYDSSEYAKFQEIPKMMRDGLLFKKRLGRKRTISTRKDSLDRDSLENINIVGIEEEIESEGEEEQIFRDVPTPTPIEGQQFFGGTDNRIIKIQRKNLVITKRKLFYILLSIFLMLVTFAHYIKGNIRYVIDAFYSDMCKSDPNNMIERVSDLILLVTGSNPDIICDTVTKIKAIHNSGLFGFILFTMTAVSDYYSANNANSSMILFRPIGWFVGVIGSIKVIVEATTYVVNSVRPYTIQSSEQVFQLQINEEMIQEQRERDDHILNELKNMMQEPHVESDMSGHTNQLAISAHNTFHQILRRSPYRYKNSNISEGGAKTKKRRKKHRKLTKKK
jgi:hypothetical protein